MASQASRRSATMALPASRQPSSIRPVAREDCSLTVVAYGYQAELARRVLERLAIEEEIFAELLVPAQLSPVDWVPLERSVAATGSLLDGRGVHRRLVVGHRGRGRAGLSAVRAPAPSSRRAGERARRHPQRTQPGGRDAGRRRGKSKTPSERPQREAGDDPHDRRQQRNGDRDGVARRRPFAGNGRRTRGRGRDEQGGAGRRGSGRPATCCGEPKRASRSALSIRSRTCFPTPAALEEHAARLAEAAKQARGVDLQRRCVPRPPRQAGR